MHANRILNYTSISNFVLPLGLCCKTKSYFPGGGTSPGGGLIASPFGGLIASPGGGTASPSAPTGDADSPIGGRSD